MPGPFEQPEAPPADKLVDTLEKGHRARQILALGVGEDLAKRRLGILAAAEMELRGGLLTPDRAFMHIACANALRKYHEELTGSITSAQKAAETLHTDPRGDDAHADD